MINKIYYFPFLIIFISIILNFISSKKKWILNQNGSLHQEFFGKFKVPLTGGIILIIGILFINIDLITLFLVLIFLIGFLADIKKMNSPN